MGKLKTLVLDSVSSPITKRVYNMVLDEISEVVPAGCPPGFAEAIVSAWRASLEDRRLGSSSIVIRMSAIRKLAAEGCGLLRSEVAALTFSRPTEKLMQPGTCDGSRRVDRSGMCSPSERRSLKTRHVQSHDGVDQGPRKGQGESPVARQSPHLSNGTCGIVTELAESGAGDEVIMSIAGHASRAMLSRYSHVRMEAKRRALDEIAARQRTADEKRKQEIE